MLTKIRDINQQKGPLADSTRLVAVDAVAMYPSIPPEGGVAAAERALLGSGMGVQKVAWLVRLLNKVLEYNVFWWKDELFQQRFGTAIGTSCAPPYSGLFMEELTTKAFKSWRENHPEPEKNLDDWTRLIDDGFGLWTGSLAVLRQLVDFLSAQEPSMKFTMEVTCPREGCPEAGEEGHECQHFLSYLDLKMFIDREGRIQTDIYRKPNRKCQYLSPDSEHPRHVFANIPKSLVHSIVRNVSVPGMLELRLEELRQMLLSLGTLGAPWSMVGAWLGRRH